MVCIDCKKKKSLYKFYPDLGVEICNDCAEKVTRNHIVVLLQFQRFDRGQQGISFGKVERRR